ncbi:hypothetical protein [Prevotella communis]|uniref:hypothetical protein n=1 Tax=Prevotella communis TaxID=2913614 RepID=UPI001EDAF55C|nr:hypothetical protein [Prevotella communis]UKK56828.1 hypothetical protein L6476_00805 [Prevotella communis]
MNFKLKLLNIYGCVRYHVYDKLTQKRCKVSLGDLMLHRAELTFGQLMATSRYMDIKAYCEKGDDSFKYLNAISRAQYGKHHGDGSISNLSFVNLIDSYKKNGYLESSLLTVDKYCNMIDGTHRIGANLYFGYEVLSARMVKRTSMTGLWQTPDQYFRTPLPSWVVDDIMDTYKTLQKRFVDSGNTLCCLLKGTFKNDSVSLISDISVLANVLNIDYFYDSEGCPSVALIQFSLMQPAYKVKNGKLFSRRAAQLEKLLLKRKQMFNLNVDIMVSKSCIEGKELWKSIRE